MTMIKPQPPATPQSTMVKIGENNGLQQQRNDQRGNFFGRSVHVVKDLIIENKNVFTFAGALIGGGLGGIIANAAFPPESATDPAARTSEHSAFMCGSILGVIFGAGIHSLIARNISKVDNANNQPRVDNNNMENTTSKNTPLEGAVEKY